MITPDIAILLLKEMKKIRRFEERIVDIYPTDVMHTPVHLCIGQEAVSVGVCANLKKEDYIFATHRSHGHSIAKGMPLRDLMAELYGKKTGCSRGFGGSMHVIDPESGNLGTSSIVGGAIPLAVGAALAIKMKNQKRVAVVFFGDGAVDQGAFWESLNFAALKKLPVLFVYENNNLAIATPVDARHATGITEVVQKFMIAKKVDGTDVLKVYSAAATALESIAKNHMPAFLECKTLRWLEHHNVHKNPLVSDQERIDKCPIKRLTGYLKESGVLTDSDIEVIDREIEKVVEDAINFAIADAPVDPADLMKEV